MSVPCGREGVIKDTAQCHILSRRSSPTAFLLACALTYVTDQPTVTPSMRLVIIDAIDAPQACGNLPKVALALGALSALSSQRRGHPRFINVVRDFVGESSVSGTMARDSLCDLCLWGSNASVLDQHDI